MIVLGDGSWRKRGFSSLFGLVSLIGYSTGNVIDIIIKSGCCKACEYGSYIGDGDSKTFAGLLKSEPYKNFEMRKKECIDHVQKRMGFGLRNLKKKVHGLGGKGKIHNSLEKMKKEIWSTLYHKLSTNENPQHSKCPAGENSWCSGQKARATNTLSTFSHKPALSKTVF